MKKLNIQKYASLILILISIFFSCKKDKAPTAETVTDVQGNVYKTIKIGSQTWMAENLKVTKLNDDVTSISFVTDPGIWSDPASKSPMTCFYNNDPANMNKYGLLYNWYAVNTGKLAPVGWHVPTEADWNVLRDFLIANGYNYDGTKVENNIAKSLAATSGWTNYPDLGNVGNDQASNNKSRFNGFPGGFRNEAGVYNKINQNAEWWTISEANLTTAHSRALDYSLRNLLDNSSRLKKFGLSVRCVKD